jgi:hypothetical protein
MWSSFGAGRRWKERSFCPAEPATPALPTHNPSLLPRGRATMPWRQMAWKAARKYPTSTLSLERQSAFYSQRASLSTGRKDAFPKEPLLKPASSTSQSQNPAYSAFSFENLGANRTTKVVVIVCLTVAGTIESILWVKVLWAKISPSPKEESNPERN